MRGNTTKKRVMWLLNHTTAREFEIPMLKALGYQEIFLPKVIPDDPYFRSASVTYNEDKNLSIPKPLLEKLNTINWYKDKIDSTTWNEINEYFDIIFFIVLDFYCLEQFLLNFKGVLIWRTYGLAADASYSKQLTQSGSIKLIRLIEENKNFFFGQAYENLSEIEENYLKNKSVFLPLGLPAKEGSENYKGGSGKLLFVLPDIITTPGFEKIYAEFNKAFEGIPKWIGGSQIIKHSGKEVLGYLSNDEYERVMTTSDVMFYHSRFPRHLHFHPLEAVRNGMPLVFLSGGMLDKLGGINLPGRAKDYKEARKKVELIINGDFSFKNEVIRTQKILLDKLSFGYCLPFWKESFEKIERIETIDPNRDTDVNKLACLWTNNLYSKFDKKEQIERLTK